MFSRCFGCEYNFVIIFPPFTQPFGHYFFFCLFLLTWWGGGVLSWLTSTHIHPFNLNSFTIWHKQFFFFMLSLVWNANTTLFVFFVCLFFSTIYLAFCSFFFSFVFQYMCAWLIMISDSIFFLPLFSLLLSSSGYLFVHLIYVHNQ